MDQERLLAQSRQLRAEAAWLRQRCAQARAKAQHVCLASDALIQSDPRYRQEAERRLLQDADRSVVDDEVQDPRAVQHPSW